MTNDISLYKKLPLGWYSTGQIKIEVGMKCSNQGKIYKITSISNKYVYCGKLKFKRGHLKFYGVGLKKRTLPELREVAKLKGFDDVTISRGCQLHGDSDYQFIKKGKAVFTLPYNY